MLGIMAKQVMQQKNKKKANKMILSKNKSKN